MRLVTKDGKRLDRPMTELERAIYVFQQAPLNQITEVERKRFTALLERERPEPGRFPHLMRRMGSCSVIL